MRRKKEQAKKNSVMLESCFIDGSVDCIPTDATSVRSTFQDVHRHPRGGWGVEVIRGRGRNSRRALNKKISCQVESRVRAPSRGAMLLTDFTYVSLLHGSVFDQSNGIFSTTRVLDGRDPGDIGHFLVAIRQWKPPTVKTTGKEKKEKDARGSECLLMAG